MSTAPAPPASSVGEMAETLAGIAGDLRLLDRTSLRIVNRVGEALRSSATETIDGLPVDLWLKNVCGIPGGEAWFYRQAADVLRHLPVTYGLWADATLVWGQVRRIVARARKLNIERRGELDRRIAATADRIGQMDPDHFCDAVDWAADELEGAARKERAEDRTMDREFLHLQPDFFGGVKMYGEYGPLSGAIITNAFDNRIGRRDHEPTAPGEATSRSQQNAAALVSMCAEDLEGSGTGKPAKPLLLVGVQLSDITPTGAGTVELDVPGMLPTLTARTVEALSTDADLRAVIFDGATPLAVSKKLHAPDIPTDTRLAVWLRDRTCRFPGSNRPTTSTHVHHLKERQDGGTHHPDNLALVADTIHIGVLHKYRWKLTLNPNDGTITATRGDRTLTRLPRWTGLARPDDRGPPNRN